MRLFLFILSILFWQGSEAQESSISTLRLQTGDCRGDSILSWPGVSLFTIYKMPEDSLVLQAYTSDFNELPVRITGLPVANYRISYENNFGQSVEQYIHTRQDSVVTIPLCPDLLNRYKGNFSRYSENSLSKLQEQDSILIKFFSQGCFHLNSLKILIRKSRQQYIAQLIADRMYLELPSRSKKWDDPDTVLQTVVLTAQNIKDFIRFENEIKFVTGKGCTTTERYEMTSKYSNVVLTDHGCRWKGFYHLRRSFFPETAAE